MSLINEALKRAQDDKERKGDAAPPPPMMVPIPDSPRKSRGNGRLTLLIALAVLAGCAGVWMLIKDKVQGTSPAQAEASSKTTPAGNASPAKADVKSITGPAEPIRVIDSRAPRSSVLQPMSAPATQPNVAAFASPTTQGSFANQAALVDANAIKGKTPFSPLTAAKADPVYHYKLTGIIRGSGGSATAVINNEFVKAGGKIEDAKLLRIGANTVDIEVKGKKVTIGM